MDATIKRQTLRIALQAAINELMQGLPTYANENTPEIEDLLDLEDELSKKPDTVLTLTLTD